ncbi:MAG: TolC family protein [Planctomycetota bacterium]|jgi:outer membrane protein TolC
MDTRQPTGALIALVGVTVGGCQSPLDHSLELEQSAHVGTPVEPRQPPPDAEAAPEDPDQPLPRLGEHATVDDYVRYAALSNPGIGSAFQRWRAAVERSPQVSALPDPHVTLGVYLREVETRTGPQEARVRLSQTFPWFGKLQDLEGAADQDALAAWRRLEAKRLEVKEQTLVSLYELRYLDEAVAITEENVELVRQFEEVIRARYRVGTGGHPEVIRAQVELGLLDDRLRQLQDLRPAFVAELNAVLNRDRDAPVAAVPTLPEGTVTQDLQSLVDQALATNPALLALDEELERERRLTEVARKEGLPDLTVGLDYIFTGDADDSSISGSGDDPVLLSFGVNVPLWRDKYDAAVRESVARRLATSHARADAANRLAAQLHRAWFDHTDADRRTALYTSTLIPKAEESLRASLASFRAGDSSFLDVLETERTLLEFAVVAERARADRGIALARINTLVGNDGEAAVAADEAVPGTEVQP